MNQILGNLFGHGWVPYVLHGMDDEKSPPLRRKEAAYNHPQIQIPFEKDDEQSPPLRRKEATVIHKYSIFSNYSSEFPLVLVPIQGKDGQFVCGNKYCDEKNGLASYEVNFSYFEAGENKQALVKLVTCERQEEPKA